MTVKNVIAGQRIARDKLERAKELRTEMTPAEAVLWEQLRRNSLGGFHFRRQQVIDGFVVDFYCHKCALVVELDGDVHDFQSGYDAQRQTHLEDRSFRVLRFSNDEVMNCLELVKNKILDTCLALEHPLPASGRGMGVRSGVAHDQV